MQNTLLNPARGSALPLGTLVRIKDSIVQDFFNTLDWTFEMNDSRGKIGVIAESERTISGNYRIYTVPCGIFHYHHTWFDVIGPVNDMDTVIEHFKVTFKKELEEEQKKQADKDLKKKALLATVEDLKKRLRAAEEEMEEIDAGGGGKRPRKK